MNKLTLLIFVLSLSCQDKARDITVQDQPYLIATESGKTFFNISSELRCRALNDFFAKFTEDRIAGGALSDFVCSDESSTRDSYRIGFQLKTSEKFAFIRLVTADRSVSVPEFCSDLAGVNCGVDPFYFVTTATNGKQPGLLDANLGELSDFLRLFLQQDQTEDLAFGMKVETFAEGWIARWNADLALEMGEASLILQLTPNSRTSLTGQAVIKKASVPHFAQGEKFWGCSDLECLKNRSYTFLFNGHHFVISHQDNDRTSYFVTPLQQL